MNIIQVTDYINTVFTHGKPKGVDLMNLYISIGKSVLQAEIPSFMSDLVKEIAKTVRQPKDSPFVTSVE